VQEKIAIHETAFVTSAFRAGNENLSRDMYAKLWPNKKTDEHAARYTNAVSKYEPFAHCLRNRYFFEEIKKLFFAKKIEVLINFGCGFSMYPFLLNEGIVHIEIDMPDVVAYKKNKVQEWQLNGKLPQREIHYIASDFNDEDFADLLLKVKSIKKGRPSFILIEGVLFFIGGSDTHRLFFLFDAIQEEGEFIGSVSFRKALEKTEVFQKLINFVEGNLEKNRQFNFQTINDEYYRNLDNYELTDHQDTLGLAAAYAPEITPNREDVLVEHMYILKKHL